MATSQAAGESKRAGAATLGVTLVLLSAVTFVGTIWATFQVAHLGTQIGISSSNDPASWFVFGSGLFISSILLGIGYTLTFLCTIYDRQESPSSGGGNHKQGTPIRIPNQPLPYRPRPTALAAEEKPAPTPSVPRTITPPPLREPKPPAPQVAEKSVLWEWLTRERHFGQTESD